MPEGEARPEMPEIPVMPVMPAMPVEGGMALPVGEIPEGAV